MRVVPKVGNLPPKFVHARPLDSRIIRYVRHGQTDGQNQRLLPLPYGGEGIINKYIVNMYHRCGRISGDCMPVVGATDEPDVVLIEAEWTAENHVEAEYVTRKLQQTRKRPASSVSVVNDDENRR